MDLGVLDKSPLKDGLFGTVLKADSKTELTV